jgi:superfamily I DNA/RNA helicase
VFGFAKGLSEVGIDIEVPAQRFGKQNFPAHDFASGRAKLMAYHSAKGLTFDSVLMPRLSAKSFPYTRSERLERLLFVAITRATKWCYFSTPLDNPLSVLHDKLVPLAESRQISLLWGQSGRSGLTVDSGEEDAAPVQAGDLDFL